MGSAQESKASGLDCLQSYRYIEGRRAGLNGLPPSLAPGRPGEPEHDEWTRGWHSAQVTLNEERNRLTLARAVDIAVRAFTEHSLLTAKCRYSKKQTCGCGGRGICLDVA